ncbi:hypothetical protein [Streptomyces anulatus]|uniref:hypothetical protein n=1 Tax=Streptomyces anulatus TaxID=1892 RepID=UPI002E811477|nr:hypothetical protein [Streptomyces anulatus]WUC91902.1 hypothetical protein OHQ35_37905 [Streptomyces anulatus]
MYTSWTFGCATSTRSTARRPTPQTSHRAAYVYWHTVATLTTAFRDLYITHNADEPPA